MPQVVVIDSCRQLDLESDDTVISPRDDEVDLVLTASGSEVMDSSFAELSVGSHR